MVLPRLYLLNLANTIYLAIFKYTPEEYLELFSDADIDDNINIIELEVVVVK